MVLFEHETGNAEAVHFIAAFLHAGVSVPFIVLTEEGDEKTVAEIIKGGTWNCVAKSQLDGATLVRTIRSTLAGHSLQQEQQTAEHSLRKLSRAVEQALRRATAEFLRLNGYTVLEARDGLDALSVARNTTVVIHLLVTDVVMPNMSGGATPARRCSTTKSLTWKRTSCKNPTH